MLEKILNKAASCRNVSMIFYVNFTYYIVKCVPKKFWEHPTSSHSGWNKYNIQIPVRFISGNARPTHLHVLRRRWSNSTDRPPVFTIVRSKERGGWVTCLSWRTEWFISYSCKTYHELFIFTVFTFIYICSCANMPIWAYEHMGICEKIWSSGVSPKKASKMELRDVNLRSVGHSTQKLWPKTFFGKNALYFVL